MEPFVRENTSRQKNLNARKLKSKLDVMKYNRDRAKEWSKTKKAMMMRIADRPLLMNSSTDVHVIAARKRLSKLEMLRDSLLKSGVKRIDVKNFFEPDEWEDLEG